MEEQLDGVNGNGGRVAEENDQRHTDNHYSHFELVLGLVALPAVVHNVVRAVRHAIIPRVRMRHAHCLFDQSRLRYLDTIRSDAIVVDHQARLHSLSQTLLLALDLFLLEADMVLEGHNEQHVRHNHDNENKQLAHNQLQENERHPEFVRAEFARDQGVAVVVAAAHDLFLERERYVEDEAKDEEKKAHPFVGVILEELDSVADLDEPIDGDDNIDETIERLQHVGHVYKSVQVESLREVGPAHRTVVTAQCHHSHRVHEHGQRVDDRAHEQELVQAFSVILNDAPVDEGAQQIEQAPDARYERQEENVDDYFE